MHKCLDFRYLPGRLFRHHITVCRRPPFRFVLLFCFEDFFRFVPVLPGWSCLPRFPRAPSGWGRGWLAISLLCWLPLCLLLSANRNDTENDEEECKDTDNNEHNGISRFIRSWNFRQIGGLLADALSADATWRIVVVIAAVAAIAIAVIVLQLYPLAPFEWCITAKRVFLVVAPPTPDIVARVARFRCNRAC